MIYDEKYFQASRRFQKRTARIERMTAEIIKHTFGKVLDVGCGIGVLVRHLRSKRIDAYGIDSANVLLNHWWHPSESFFQIADAKNLPFSDKSFDLVFSSDFFEHIPEEEIDQVITEMKRVGKKVIAVIALETMLTERQQLYHVTNKPLEWWEKKLGIKVIPSHEN